MLQNIRDNAQGLVSKILVGLIAFTFVIWGAESLFTSYGYDDSPVSVNGEEVSAQDWLQASELQRRQLLNSNPDIDPATLDVNAIQSATLEQMIREKVLLQFADENDFTISDASIDKIIIASDNFKVDEKFDMYRFESMVASAGMTVNSYKQQLKQNSLINQVQQGFALTAFTLPELAQQVAALDGQTRDIATLVLSFNEQLSKTQVSEDAVVDYYNENSAQYQSPEQMKIDYVELDKNSFLDKINITDEALRNAYEESKAQWQTEAAQERSVAHILFNIDDSQSEEEALKLANSAYAKLESGESFASVASASSQDSGSANMGGGLGSIAIGEFGGKFDEVLASLEVGQYSKPVVTEFGVQIIQTTTTEAEEYPSFADQVDSVKENLQSEEANKLFASASATLEDLAFSSENLQEISDELDLTINTSAWFPRLGAQEFEDQAQRVANVAFADEVLQGNNSDAFAISTDKLVVLRMNEHQPQKQQALDEVKQLVRDQLANSQALRDLQDKVEVFINRLNTGESPESIAAEVGLNWQVANTITRSGSNVSPLISQAAFRLPRPSESTPVYGSSTDYTGDIALIHLQAVNDADVSAYDEAQKADISFAIERINGQSDATAFNTSINNKADIEHL